MSLPAAAKPVAFVFTADRAKSKPFYEDVLGLPLIADEPFGVVFDLGSGATMRLTDLKEHVPSPHTVMGWEVSDLAGAMATLRDKGVTFEIYPDFGMGEDAIWSHGGTSLAWFLDPEGNNLSLAQHG